jgi:hypothetical protein
MITLLTSAAHDYTHRPLEGSRRFEFKVLSYTRALRARSLARGTYLFADVDRLGFWELELASRLYRCLAGAGLRVLNDPARARQRLSLLRELQHRGINAFGAWQADDTARPRRYPAFLRTQSAHRGTLSDLLNDEAEVTAAIEGALASGVPMRELMVVEYCAQPVREGLFRKLAAFRAGDRMLCTLSVHERHWAAKYGELGVADQALYDDEYDIVARNRYGEALRPAFEAAGIEYGRADFALVDGRPQVYEINSNPMLERITTHPFPVRLRTDALFFERLEDAMAALDSPGTGPAVRLDDEILVRQRRHDRLMTRSRWTP